MNKDKDYSLLRSFDPEKAKAGEAIVEMFGIDVTYIDGPNIYNVVVCKCADGRYGLFKSDRLRMVPLAWVEGKPVYKGDVLWCKSDRNQYEVDRVDEQNCRFFIKPLNSAGHLGRSFNLSDLSWEAYAVPPTKKTKTVKLLAFVGQGGYLRWCDETRYNNYPHCYRIPSEDKTVEVEIE